MRRQIVLLMFILVSSCGHDQNDDIVLNVKLGKSVEYIIYGQDTLSNTNGDIRDTFLFVNEGYDYLQLSTWKWPKLFFIAKNKELNFNFSEQVLKADSDIVNDYLFNLDSILIPYSLRWDMAEADFKEAMQYEIKVNANRIDSVFSNAEISAFQLDELKQIELLKVAHRTANFISFQENKGNQIDRSIYDFVEEIDLNNPRLEKQVNNRNFQYYYLLDKVSEEIPDSIYPFAAIDTINKYSKIESIRKMIISSVVKNAFYDETVDHEALLEVYKESFGALKDGDKILALYEKIQNLMPGKVAPAIGELERKEGGSLSIEDLRGNNVLLTVWGSWCPYCKEEFSHLNSLINKYGDNFISVGISFDEDKTKWKEYIDENNWGGIHLIDPNRNSVFKSNYLVSGTNVHILIDKKGVILSPKNFKPSSKEMEALLKDLDKNPNK